MLPYSTFPLQLSLQKFVLYETKARFYLVGSNKVNSKFKMLKIDRTYSSEPNYEIAFSEDNTEYSRAQIQDLLMMIGEGNRANGGLTKLCSAYGVLGFIRFLHGYYLILITKRRKVGMIGCHYVYGIDDISYIYVPPYFPKNQTPDLVDETKYKALFLGLDLTRDFYFSYTYDLTHTLQYNLIKGSRGEYNSMFVWNHHLLKELNSSVSSLWVLPIIHGYYAQSKTSVFGRTMDFILIARRSRNFAGTRFLKRGINAQGHVANDVETEQIVQYPITGVQMRFSSFVQVRGSIPLYWAQDNSMIAPKPPILMMRMDPFYGSTLRHFQDVISRYGSPIVILNLVKANEKRPRESILRTEFTTAIEFVNSTLPDSHEIDYHAWDFHYAAKSKTEDHLGWLANFATQSLEKTGVFVSGVSTQCGTVRTNCIDSLDRTNAAQYMVGKTMLQAMLTGLGVGGTATVVDTEREGEGVGGDLEAATGGEMAVGTEILLDMYEGLGNQIALQYGGSELANTMKTYTKHSLSSQSRDLFNAIRRYYSNSFTDAEKQHSINLFLGTFIPSEEPIALWNIETDYYIHNKPDAPEHLLLSNTNWWENAVETFKDISHGKGCQEFDYTMYYEEVYQPQKMTLFDKVFSHRFNIPLQTHHHSYQLPQQELQHENPSPEPSIQSIPSQMPSQPEEQQGIKRWIFAWKKARPPVAKRLKMAEKRKTPLPQDSSGKDKPLARYGLELDHKAEDINYYRKYVSHPSSEQQAPSNHSYYQSYLSSLKPPTTPKPQADNRNFYEQYREKYISRLYPTPAASVDIYFRYCSI